MVHLLRSYQIQNPEHKIGFQAVFAMKNWILTLAITVRPTSMLTTLCR